MWLTVLFRSTSTWSRGLGRSFEGNATSSRMFVVVLCCCGAGDSTARFLSEQDAHREVPLRFRLAHKWVTIGASPVIETDKCAYVARAPLAGAHG